MTTPTTTRKPGRPPAGHRAATDAERAKAYRRRTARAANEAMQTPHAQTDPVLLRALAYHLRGVAGANTEMQSTHRWVAERLVRTLIDRHNLKP